MKYIHTDHKLSRNKKKDLIYIFLNLGVNFFLFLFNSFIFLKKIFFNFLIYIVYYPGRWLSNFIFHKMIIKLYSQYLSFIKKIGFNRFRKNIYSFLFNQKLVHITVIISIIFFTFLNLAIETKAVGPSLGDNKIILTNLVKSEFNDVGNMDLITETSIQSPVANLPQSYMNNLNSFNPQPRVEFKKSIVDKYLPSTIQNGTAIVKPNIALTKKTKQPRTKIITYTIKPGDTISTIAEKFGISVNTVLWANNLSSYSIIRPGNILRILPMTGISVKITKGQNLNLIAKKYKVKIKDILTANKLSANYNLKIGQVLIIPGGSKLLYHSYTPKKYTGISALRKIVKTPKAKYVASNKMHWPTVGRRITQYYSWRHHAIDIANHVGTPIYAADSGRIIHASWSRGYGNNIVIDHGGGKKTRYAHLSKYYVKVGDRVSKGQTIGAMGSTGWSTGPHVHFEVIINGRRYNPLNYL